MKKLILGKKGDDETLIIDPNRLVSVKIECASVGNNDYVLDTRDGGAFKGKAIYLDEGFEWVIGQDDEDVTCLVPLRCI